MRKDGWLWRLVASPAVHGLWSCIVIGSLVAGYFVDPYAFGIGALILAPISAPVVASALLVAVLSKTTERPVRIVLAVTAVVTASALVVSFAMLRTFHWA